MDTKITPKDFFLHLGATIVLYIAAGALISLWFSVIDHALPDALAGYFSASSVAWPISMLAVLTPVLYLLEWLIARDIRLDPAKKGVWIRRWRVYLTLFLAAAFVIGDFIALINVYLNGEITARFAWKAFAILLIASTIGKYYFFSLYESFRYAPAFRRIHAWLGLVLVLAAIVGGFMAVGSPATRRAIRFDQQRVSDLSNIQWQVVNYWQQKGRLPQSLADLSDSISGFEAPKDPETDAPYVYLKIPAVGETISAAQFKALNSGLFFQLCATFDRASEDLAGKGGSYGGGIAYPTPASYPGVQGDSWAHPAGHACFDRSIDPSRYPLNKAVPQ